MVQLTKILGGPWHGRTLQRRPPWLHPFPNFCEHLFHAPLTEGSHEQIDSESGDTQTQTPAITLAYLLLGAGNHARICNAATTNARRWSGLGRRSLAMFGES